MEPIERRTDQSINLWECLKNFDNIIIMETYINKKNPTNQWFVGFQPLNLSIRIDFFAEREVGEPIIPYNLKSMLYFSKFSSGNELGTKITTSFVHL